MKKHPIDDLFARTLGEHAEQPRHASWDKLQQRMNPQPVRRIGGGWWYAAAASVLVLLLSGWWGLKELKQNKNIKHDSFASAQESNIVSKLKESSIKGKARIRIESRNEALPQLAVNPSAVEASPSASTKDEVQLDVSTAKGGSEDLLVVEKESINSQSPQKEVEDVMKPVQTKEDLTTERTLVVQIEEPTLETVNTTPASLQTEIPSKKRFRVGRLLRQLNNLREGDPVDLKETGLNPEMLLAKASETVERGREKISDSYESLRTKAFVKQSDNK